MTEVIYKAPRLLFRALPILATLSFLIGCLAKAQVKSDRERDDLFGSVHIVRSEKIILPGAGDNTSGQKTEIAEVAYNEKGNTTEEIKYKADGSLLNKSIFEYDSAENLIAVTVYNADGSMYLKRTYSHTKRPAERKTEESISAGDTSLVSKVTHTYDTKGRVTESSAFDANGKPKDRQVSIYNANGKLAEINYFQGSNSQTGKIVLVYDAQGNLAELDEYDADGSLGGKKVFSGDTERGTDITMTEFDSKENLVSKERYVRELDSHGNWTKDTKSKLNMKSGRMETVEITHRQITYY